MVNAKLLTAAFLAALALFAVVADSASATTAGWMSSGSLISGSVPLASTSPVDRKYQLNGGGLNIECEGSSTHKIEEIHNHTVIVGLPLLNKKTILSCTTTNANCTVPALTTVPLIAEPTLEGTLGVRLVTKPISGTTIATVKFSGELCAVAGTKAITGDFNSALPTGQDERTSQLQEINVSTAQNLLFIASSAASFTGAELLTLASGKPWSFL
jgi:hypothetical protein